MSAIPRNKVANLKKRKQETRQNISEIWELKRMQNIPHGITEFLSEIILSQRN